MPAMVMFAVLLLALVMPDMLMLPVLVLALIVDAMGGTFSGRRGTALAIHPA